MVTIDEPEVDEELDELRHREELLGTDVNPDLLSEDRP
jgi:hypothetical protein